MTPADPEIAARLTRGCFASVDPGVDYPAAAVFHYGVLTAASRVHIPTRVRDIEQEGERARQVVALIASWILERASGAQLVAVVHEWPKAYTQNKSKGSAQGLFPLAAIGAGVAIRLDVPAISPMPADWIGSIRKDTTLPKERSWESPRGRLIHRRLRELERAAVVLSHDAVDAVGIGAWALGRLERVLVGTT